LSPLARRRTAIRMTLYELAECNEHLMIIRLT
jgi:hypothetical protein